MKGSIVIPQNLLKSFIKQKKLSGTVSFLRFLRKGEGLNNFHSFCKKNNHILPPIGHFMSNVLFHGSQKPQSILRPNTSIGRGGKTERKALVYATDEPNYAIFLAILQLINASAGVLASDKDPILTVDLDFVNSQSKLKNGYVHIVSSEFFKKVKNGEYKTDKLIPVLFSILVTPQDLIIPIYIQTSA